MEELGVESSRRSDGGENLIGALNVRGEAFQREGLALEERDELPAGLLRLLASGGEVDSDHKVAVADLGMPPRVQPSRRAEEMR